MKYKEALYWAELEKGIKDPFKALMYIRDTFGKRFGIGTFYQEFAELEASAKEAGWKYASECEDPVPMGTEPGLYCPRCLFIFGYTDRKGNPIIREEKPPSEEEIHNMLASPFPMTREEREDESLINKRLIANGYGELYHLVPSEGNN